MLFELPKVPKLPKQFFALPCNFTMQSAECGMKNEPKAVLSVFILLFAYSFQHNL